MKANGIDRGKRKEKCNLYARISMVVWVYILYMFIFTQISFYPNICLFICFFNLFEINFFFFIFTANRFHGNCCVYMCMFLLMLLILHCKYAFKAYCHRMHFYMRTTSSFVIEISTFCFPVIIHLPL